MAGREARGRDAETVSLLSHPRPWFAGLLVWMGALWWLSSRSGVPGPDLIPHFDKVLHFGYFALGSFLFSGWQARKLGLRRIPGRLIALAVAFGALVGAVDEWHQLHTPGRSGGDVGDWVADVLGAAAGALALRAAYSRRG